MTETITIKLKTAYTSLHNKLYDTLKQQLTSRLSIESDQIKLTMLLGNLQTTIQTQFNTLLYTEEELREPERLELQRQNEIDEALGSGDEEKFGTLLMSIYQTHVEKYNK